MRKYRFIKNSVDRIEIQWGWLCFWFDLEGYNRTYGSIELAKIGLEEYKRKRNNSGKVIWEGF